MEFIASIFTFIASVFSASPAVLEQPVEPPAEVLVVAEEADNEPNEYGRIPIFEYHSIGETEGRWRRQADNFWNDLLWLYNNDYYLLSIDDYADDHYPVPRGRKPVVITFDDGNNNQFRYLEDGSIDPRSAVGVLDRFYAEYPDFGSAVVFYVNEFPFGPSDEVEAKMKHLHEMGRQVGYHTINHTQLDAYGPEGVAEILTRQDDHLSAMMPEGMSPSKTVAYPHGSVPWGDLTAISDVLEVGLLIGARPAYPLYHESADPYRTPRIQAIEEEWLRHFGRNPGETAKADSEKFKPFVSDGNPRIIEADETMGN